VVGDDGLEPPTPSV